jgi:hypothetical protein
MPPRTRARSAELTCTSQLHGLTVARTTADPGKCLELPMRCQAAHANLPNPAVEVFVHGVDAMSCAAGVQVPRSVMRCHHDHNAIERLNRLIVAWIGPGTCAGVRAGRRGPCCQPCSGWLTAPTAFDRKR